MSEDAFPYVQPRDAGLMTIQLLKIGSLIPKDLKIYYDRIQDPACDSVKGFSLK